MGLSGQSTGTLVGTAIGAIIGAVLAVPTLGISVYAGIALGADVGAVPPVRSLPCPDPVLSRLINSVRTVPFRLGSRDPASGGLDCGGLVVYLLQQGRGLAFPAAVQGVPLLTPPLQPVWTQRRHNPTWWLTKVHPWDVVVWHDAAAAGAVGWDVERQGPLAHCGLVISAEVLVSSCVDLGVAFFGLQRIADHYGPDVWAVLRPPAPERNHYGPLYHL